MTDTPLVPPPAPILVTREVPLYWLLSVIGAILVFAGTVYFTQQRQGEVLVELRDQVKLIAASIDARAVKEQEYGFRITDLEHRVTKLEEGAKK